jgi:Fe-S-cluster containining protein
MDGFQTDLEEIKRITERDLDDNYQFRHFLKASLRWSDGRLDEVVHEIVADVSAEIDCTACSNCCICMSATVGPTDIKRLAKRLEMPGQDFISRYCIENEFGEHRISQMPCPFLNECVCTVYEDRPKNCREFPHLHKKDVRCRSIGLIQNAEICPIAFNVLEELKWRVNWRRRG